MEQGAIRDAAEDVGTGHQVSICCVWCGQRDVETQRVGALDLPLWLHARCQGALQAWRELDAIWAGLSAKERALVHQVARYETRWPEEERDCG